ncbi:MAG: HAMP domain-containing histidine kinase [Rhodocyclaceae bacterium]|nr:HAMP domain-containing histidine kinase [Rhodocyclaceae bacterium]MBX3671118.1 HAMP domain-containing histidine kinase [Rhodocyclaceae bacterium]
MKFPGFELPALSVPRLPLAAFRGRLIFRGAFCLLVLATLALAAALLQEEKQRSYQNYRQSFSKTEAEILARLRHPAGQLALLNPGSGGTADGVRPLLLPYGAIDFDDQYKAQQAVELAGCSVRYAGGGALCAAVGNNPYAGGFIYLVGSFVSGPLASHSPGQLDLEGVHRVNIELAMRGTTESWIAPYEALPERGTGSRGRLAGYAGSSTELSSGVRPVRDFRGWLWSGECADADDHEPDCARRMHFSVRLPVDAFRIAVLQKPRPLWPPPDLDQMRVSVKVYAPARDEPIFDSSSADATPPPALADFARDLLPGETLAIRKAGRDGPDLFRRTAADAGAEPASPWLMDLVRALPVADYASSITAHDLVTTAAGNFDIRLEGDARGVERGLAAVATRMSWFVGAMLAAIVTAWLVIELWLVRRITALTRRAAAVSYNMQDAQVERRLGELDVSDLRGRDEIGILAGGLADLLQRVKEGMRREHIRAVQERDMWHAVGHEIMSPLQSLMVLHADEGDPSRRYVARMQQAVRVLYGTASPSEALAAADLQAEPLDLDDFLRQVAANAHFAGIEGVRFTPLGRPVMVRADEYSLEDAVTHLLRNADRYRHAGTPIVLGLAVTADDATVSVHNSGPHIDASLIERIFDYGVSEAAAGSNGERRGQGLFVAKTYLAKMGGTISAANAEDGVIFRLGLPRAN